MDWIRIGEVIATIITSILGARWLRSRAARRQEDTQVAREQYQTVDQIVSMFTQRLSELSEKLSTLTEKNHELLDLVDQSTRKIHAIERELEAERQRTNILQKELEHERQLVSAMEAYLLAHDAGGGHLDDLRRRIEEIRAAAPGAARGGA